MQVDPITPKLKLPGTQRSKLTSDEPLSNFAFEARGRAVQVDPITPKLKLPGTQRSKLTSDEPLSNFAFEINLRRYNEARHAGGKYGDHATQTALAGNLQVPLPPLLSPPFHPPPFPPTPPSFLPLPPHVPPLLLHSDC